MTLYRVQAQAKPADDAETPAATDTDRKRQRLALQPMPASAQLPLAGTLRELYTAGQIEFDTQSEVLKLLAERGNRTKSVETQAAQFEDVKRQLQQQVQDAERRAQSLQSEVARANAHIETQRAQAAAEAESQQKAIIREVERSVALTTQLKEAQAAKVHIRPCPADDPRRRMSQCYGCWKMTCLRRRLQKHGHGRQRWWRLKPRTLWLPTKSCWTS